MGTNSRLPIPVVTVKYSALTAVPPGATTLIGPLVAPGGTMTSILVPDTISNSRALTPLNSMEVASNSLVPVRVTRVPTGPLVGVNWVMVGERASRVVAMASFDNTEAPVMLNTRTR